MLSHTGIYSRIRSAYSALSSGFDYVFCKYFVYGNWFTCEERKRLGKETDLLVELLHVVVISYLISGYFIMGILEKIAEIESEVYISISCQIYPLLALISVIIM